MWPVLKGRELTTLAWTKLLRAASCTDRPGTSAPLQVLPGLPRPLGVHPWMLPTMRRGCIRVPQWDATCRAKCTSGIKAFIQSAAIPTLSPTEEMATPPATLKSLTVSGWPWRFLLQRPVGPVRGVLDNWLFLAASPMVLLFRCLHGNCILKPGLPRPSPFLQISYRTSFSSKEPHHHYQTTS